MGKQTIFHPIAIDTTWIVVEARSWHQYVLGDLDEGVKEVTAMEAQVLRDKHAVTNVDYIIHTGTIWQHDLYNFCCGLLANIN